MWTTIRTGGCRSHAGSLVTSVAGKVSLQYTPAPWLRKVPSLGPSRTSAPRRLHGSQEKVNVPVSVNSNKKGRGVPDLAAVADPATGYNVLVDGDRLVIGGTSAVAPLMAGLIARINEGRNKNAGFIHPELYRNLSVCRDITQGDNITTPDNKGYKAGAGWDACTGCGTPIGSALGKVLKG